MEQSELLRFLCSTLERLGLEYLITGSQATIAFGEPRFTNDIDVVVDLELKDVESFCEAFPDTDFYLNSDTVRAEVQRRGMFNIIHPASGLKIDIVVAKDTDFDRQRLSRAVCVPIADDLEASFASPEDVILKKLEWYQMSESDRHLRDIAGVIKVQGASLDRNHIELWAKRFDLLEIWQMVLRDF